MEDLIKQSGESEIKEAISYAVEDIQRKIDRANKGNTEKKKERARILWEELKTKVKGKDRIQADSELKSNMSDFKVEDFTVMLTSQSERKTSRREGLSERNNLERMVVQKSLENFVLARHIKAITDV